MPVVTDVTAPLAAELDALCELDRALLSDGDTVVALHRQLARLEALVTRAAAAFDAGGSWEADGARSAAQWVGVRCQLSSAVARRRVKQGREVRSMPCVQAAWAAGDINESHVSLLVGARNRNPECFARDEELLVGEAKALLYRHFVRALAYWAQLADPDGAEERAAQNYDKRDFSFSQGWEGCWFPDGMVDPIGGAIVDHRQGCIYHELFRADWAEAKARVGEGVCLADLARTPAQLVPYLDDAWVDRLVYDGPSRVIDVGVRRRFFTGASRRAIEVRDRGCAHEFCDLAADRCDIDHVKPFSEGGLTTTDNGRPECGWHNRWKDKQRRRGPPAA